MHRRLPLLVALAVALVLVPLPGTASATAAAARDVASMSAAPAAHVQHLHFRYGPLHIAPGQNLITTNHYRIPQPSHDGWIVGFRPNITLANGKVPPVDVIHLHHGVWATALHRDATYPFFPERFFFSGEEKTALELPPGYGYRYRASDGWYVNYMIHDLTPRPYTVWLTYDVDFVRADDSTAATMRDVHPIWMDVRNGEVYPVFDAVRGAPTRSTFTYPDDDPNAYPLGKHTNEYRLPSDGVLIHTYGHLHPGGLHDDLWLERDGRTAHLFRSSAHYYEPAGAVSWDVSMTTTRPDWAVAVHRGDVLRITTTYDTSKASWYESMGIMIGWMYDGPGGRDPFTTKVDRPGVLTHGHLPENDHHGGGKSSLTDPRAGTVGPSSSTIDIGSFEYSAGDLNAKGKVPTVTVGQSITFDNLDATGHGVWHTITACKAPCTASTGIAYPLANAVVQFDSGQLGEAGPPTAGRDTWTTPANLAPGTYTYFCRIHPFMRGAFRVVAAPNTWRTRLVRAV